MYFKTSTILAITTCAVLLASSCNSANQDNTSSHVIVQGNVQGEPEALFKHGMDGFYQFVRKNLSIPPLAKYYGVNAEVDMAIQIDPTGKVSNVKVIEERIDAPVEFGIDEPVIRSLQGVFAIEAERILWLTDTLWIAPTQDGKPVTSTQVLSFTFTTLQYVHNQDQVKNGEPLSFGSIENPNSGTPIPNNQRFNNNLYQMGTKLMISGNLKTAGRFFSYCVQINPEQVDAWFNLALCYKKTGLLKEACEAWAQAANLGDIEAKKLLVQFCN